MEPLPRSGSPSFEAPGRSGPTRWILLVLAVVAAGVLVVAGPSATVQHPPDTGIEHDRFSERPRFADPVDPVGEASLAVVARFERALDEHDVAAALEVVAADFVWLELPGTLVPVRGADAPDLPPRLGFATAAVAMDLGVCRADPVGSAEPGERRVICPSAAVSGSYADGLGRAGTGQRIAFGIRGGEIISMFWSEREGEALLVHSYCAYARDTFGDLASGAFDESCRPVETPATAPLHAEMAAAFIAAGRPLLDEPGLARRSREIVEEFVAAHNAGADPFELVARDFFVVRFPGLLLDPGQPPFPEFSEFLAWSSRMYTIDLGACTSRLIQAAWPVSVECPDARWGGPLPEALGLGPLQQPISFWVDDFVITGFTGDTHHDLRAAAERACRVATETDPAAAAAVFREDCVPRHAADRSDELLELVAGAGGPAG